MGLCTPMVPIWMAGSAFPPKPSIKWALMLLSRSLWKTRLSALKAGFLTCVHWQKKASFTHGDWEIMGHLEPESLNREAYLLKFSCHDRHYNISDKSRVEPCTLLSWPIWERSILVDQISMGSWELTSQKRCRPLCRYPSTKMSNKFLVESFTLSFWLKMEGYMEWATISMVSSESGIRWTNAILQC